jgi:hypothetical protein
MEADAERVIGYWQEPSSTNWLAVAMEARERVQARIF